MVLSLPLGYVVGVWVCGREGVREWGWGCGVRVRQGEHMRDVCTHNNTGARRGPKSADILHGLKGHQGSHSGNVLSILAFSCKCTWALTSANVCTAHEPCDGRGDNEHGWHAAGV